MMTVFFSSDDNLAGAPVDRLQSTENGRKVVKEGFNLINLDGPHQQTASEILYKNGRHPLTTGPLHMHLINLRDGANTNQAHAIKLRKLRNTSSALMYRHSRPVDNMTALVNNAGAFDSEYSVKAVDAA